MSALLPRIGLSASIAFFLASSVLADDVPQDRQFDLLCQVQSFRTPVDSLRGTEFQGEQRFRIDLAKRRWCVEECNTTEVLIGSTRELIVLKNDKWDGGGDQLSISRESGRLTASGYDRNDLWGSSGNCEKKTFTGFPTPKF